MNQTHAAVSLHLNVGTFAGNDAACGSAHVASSDAADLLHHHWHRHVFLCPETSSGRVILINARPNPLAHAQ